MLARYSRGLNFQKRHFAIGLTISLLFTLIVAFQRFNFWVWQAEMVSNLLSFAGVPNELFIWDNIARGPTFQVLINSQPMPFAIAIGIIIILSSIILALNISKKIPAPVKTVTFVISIVTISTILWQTVISPTPSYTLHWVTLDWSCSGAISLCLISLIFAPFLFTIKVPLWVKVLWLFITIGFSILWNLLRMSLVTATLYYFGDLVFLLSHYFVGAFVDFVYIVAFYSLALFHLSKFEQDGGID